MVGWQTPSYTVFREMLVTASSSAWEMLILLVCSNRVTCEVAAQTAYKQQQLLHLEVAESGSAQECSNDDLAAEGSLDEDM